MANITYLLGAGASANCLPIVNTIPNKLEILIRNLQNFRDSINVGGQELTALDKDTFTEYSQLAINDLTWLLHQSQKHSTIDTFAKKLYIIEDNKSLTKLKIALSSFLSFEEHRNAIDIRYDTFYASILGKRKLSRVQLSYSLGITIGNLKKRTVNIQHTSGNITITISDKD